MCYAQLPPVDSYSRPSEGGLPVTRRGQVGPPPGPSEVEKQAEHHWAGPEGTLILRGPFP